MDPAANVAALASALAGIPAGALVVAPQGVLSGYLPKPGFVDRLDPAATGRAIDTAAALSRKHGVTLVPGACLHDAERGWRNAEAPVGAAAAVTAPIDLRAVSDWAPRRTRRDLS